MLFNLHLLPNLLYVGSTQKSCKQFGHRCLVYCDIEGKYEVRVTSLLQQCALACMSLLRKSKLSSHNLKCSKLVKLSFKFFSVAYIRPLERGEKHGRI